MRILPLVFLLAACSPGFLIPTGGSQLPKDTADTDADADADADSDSDSDSDSDADADVKPQLTCGPYVAPDSGMAVVGYTGEGTLDMNDNWTWEGCEVERSFDSAGAIECEILWQVTGSYYDWDGGTYTARYELTMMADDEAGVCPDRGNQQTLYYEAVFDWDRGEMTLGRSEDWRGPFDAFAVAEITSQGRWAPYSYTSAFFR